MTAVGDNGSYDYDSMIFYVSEKVDKNEFHNASNYIKGTAEIYQDHLRENIKLDKKGRRQKLSATPDLSGTVLPLCLIPNSALKSAPPFKSVVPK
ncbi:hypothetical protein, partial [Pseudomonas aeruginosa]|uniref:hypothetical protein n=1 Tax=Pseudomonas aeruginosa TaxID=287 RepID=UPI001F482980